MNDKKGVSFLMELLIVVIMGGIIVFLLIGFSNDFYPKATAAYMDLIPTIGCNGTEGYILNEEIFEECKDKYLTSNKLLFWYTSTDFIPKYLWEQYVLLDDSGICSKSPSDAQKILCEQITCLKSKIPLDAKINDLKRFILQIDSNPSVLNTLTGENEEEVYYIIKCQPKEEKSS